MKSITIKAYTTDNNQINAVKAFMKALKIKYEVTKEESYNPEFVNMVLDAEKEIKTGKSKKISSNEFDQLWK